MTAAFLPRIIKNQHLRCGADDDGNSLPVGTGRSRCAIDSVSA